MQNFHRMLTDSIKLTSDMKFMDTTGNHHVKCNKAILRLINTTFFCEVGILYGERGTQTQRETTETETEKDRDRYEA